MKQQDWIDFFQAVHGRNPSIQEMAEAANRGRICLRNPQTNCQSNKKTLTKRDCRKDAKLRNC